MKILIAIPCYGGNVSDSTASGIYKLTKAFERANIFNEMLLIANESLISTGRSNIANFFINNTTHDYILCIDSDMGFESQDVFDLLELQTEFSCAPYSMKVIPAQYNFSLSGPPLIWNAKRNAVSVEHIGTGFQLVHRSVFEKLGKKHPELQYIPKSQSREISQLECENSFHFYETFIHPKTKHIVSEDFAFCHRWRNIGGFIWMMPHIKLTHTGSHVFHGIENLEQALK